MKFKQGAIRIPPQQCLQIVTANDLLVERIAPPRKRGRTRGRVQSWLGLIRRHHSDARGATGQKGEQGDADQTALRNRVATGNRLYSGFESHRQELSAHRGSAGKGYPRIRGPGHKFDFPRLVWQCNSGFLPRAGELAAVDGKPDFKARFTGAGFKFNFASVTVADDAVADDQAEAGAGANGFCGEKWLEHV